MDETTDPLIESQLKEPVRRERAALRVLARKWRSGTITAQEKDDLLKRLVLLLLGVP